MKSLILISSLVISLTTACQQTFIPKAVSPAEQGVAPEFPQDYGQMGSTVVQGAATYADIADAELTAFDSANPVVNNSINNTAPLTRTRQRAAIGTVWYPSRRVLTPEKIPTRFQDKETQQTTRKAVTKIVTNSDRSSSTNARNKTNKRREISSMEYLGGVLAGLGVVIGLYVSWLVGLALLVAGVMIVIRAKGGLNNKVNSGEDTDEDKQLQDIIYLKNGSVIKGTIIEQVPNQSIRIRTRDGSVFVHEMIDVIKITKE